MDEPKVAAPMAGDGEASVSGLNMAGSPVPKVPGEPVDYAKVAQTTVEATKSTIPIMMSDADALTVGREVEARYVPPAPAPSVLEQVEAAKKAKA